VIALFSTDQKLSTTIQGWLRGTHVRVSMTWNELELIASRASACVLAIPDLQQPVDHELIERIQRRTRFVPIILVTRFDRDNARALKGCRVAEVVWQDDAPTSLWPAIERAGRFPASSRLAEWVRANPRLDGLLRDALLAICLSEPPLSSVEAAAKCVHASVSTLETKWRGVLGPAGKRSLRRFVMSCRLLWAIDQLSLGTKKAAVAHQLGVDLSTLSRTSLSLTGKTLRALSDQGPEPLLTTVIDLMERGGTRL
jgi:hypothetical protein